MRLLLAAFLAVALAGCSVDSHSETETSVTGPDGTKTSTRIETKTHNGVTTDRKTETVTKGGQTTKTVYEKKGGEWVKVE